MLPAINRESSVREDWISDPLLSSSVLEELETTNIFKFIWIWTSFLFSQLFRLSSQADFILTWNELLVKHVLCYFYPPISSFSLNQVLCFQWISKQNRLVTCQGGVWLAGLKRGELVAWWVDISHQLFYVTLEALGYISSVVDCRS